MLSLARSPDGDESPSVEQDGLVMAYMMNPAPSGVAS